MGPRVFIFEPYPNTGEPLGEAWFNTLIFSDYHDFAINDDTNQHKKKKEKAWKDILVDGLEYFLFSI